MGQRGAARKGLLHKEGSLGAVTTAVLQYLSTACWQGVESHPEAEGRDKTKYKDTT